MDAFKKSNKIFTKSLCENPIDKSIIFKSNWAQTIDSILISNKI